MTPRRLTFGAELGRRIALRREELGILQVDLAHEVGMGVPRLSDLERGVMLIGPNALTLRRIAAALDLTLDELVPSEDCAA